MKSLVLLSGGLDSTTALAVALRECGWDRRDVMTLSFAYNSKHNDQELKAAHKVASYYGVRNDILEVNSAIFGTKSTLMKGGGEIPNEEYHDAEKESPSSTVVPFRNAVFISMGVAYAITCGASEVFIAAHSTDAKGFAYPDCSPEFLGAFSAAVYVGTVRQVRLRTPFLTWTKSDIVSHANKLKVPFYLTRSCYNGGEVPCRTCPTCRERALAFAEAGVVDPLTK